MRIEELLRTWLPAQRWFAGKDRAIDETTIVADTELRGGDPALRHLVVAVRQGGHVDRYQMLLGLREHLPDRLRHVEIGWVSGDGAASGWAYDAAHDAELTRILLDGMATGMTKGELAFRHTAGARIRVGLSSLAIGAEQSNTSLVYGESYICKLFRRLTPGRNPDLELTAALAQLGSSHVAEPYGWMEMPLDGEPTTLAILSRYLPTATDGWTLAATSIRDLYAHESLAAAEAGGDFAGESGRLGVASAEVHRDLARAFGVERMGAQEVRRLARDMRKRLDVASAQVPELAPYGAALRAAFDDLARVDTALPIQRIHGDYHLGQVVRTEQGWVVLDFEGEPVAPLAERRRPASPLRDVAGMLRSFEYAARYQLIGHPLEEKLEPLARDWSDRNRAAFCAGYADAAGFDPREQAAVLRAFEFDKAVYEVVYEARNRPSWLPIPLGSIARLAGDGPLG